jgi:hypothetical protein
VSTNPFVRLQAYFHPSVYQRLQEQAHHLDKSIAQIVREAVEQYLTVLEQEPANPDDPIWRIPALASKYAGSRLIDAAIRHDEHLYDREGIG